MDRFAHVPGEEGWHRVSQPQAELNSVSMPNPLKMEAFANAAGYVDEELRSRIFSIRFFYYVVLKIRNRTRGMRLRG